MQTKRIWLIMIPVFGLFFSGCAMNVATTKETNFDKKPMGLIGVPKYSVLGTVILEKDWFGIFGFTIPSTGNLPASDLYVYQSGGVTYVDLLAEAKEQYADADAVIDIKVDYSRSNYCGFYASRKNILSGIAIKYSRDIVDYHPNETFIIKEKK
jgi:hypothetical protein